MDDNEVEEGEARIVDNETKFDLDVALSYIDERLVNILGNCQKDFEGQVTTESLGKPPVILTFLPETDNSITNFLTGPKHGEYGSFLPMYKRPPLTHSHTIPLQNVPSFSRPCASNNCRSEGALINPIAPIGRNPITPTSLYPITPVGLNPITPVGVVRCVATSHHKDIILDQNTVPVNVSARKDASKNEATTSKVANPSGQSSLRLRIKVGSDNPARKNDDISSGLGRVSPSSSTESDSEDSDGSPIASPSSILLEMISIFIPENRLLSPLNESLLCLTKTERILDNKVTPPIIKFVDASSSLPEEVKQMEVKEVSSRDKSELVDRMKNEGDKAPLVEKRIDIESFDGKRGLTINSKGKLSSYSIIAEANQAAKKDIVPVKKREIKGELINNEGDKGLFPEKVVKIESFDGRWGLTNDSKVKPSSYSKLSVAIQEAKKDVIPVKKRERQGALIKHEGDMGLFSEKGVKTESSNGIRDLTNDSRAKPSSDSKLSEAIQLAKEDIVPVKKRETQGELIEDQIFSPDLTSKESEERVKHSSIEHYEETKPKAITSGGIRSNTVHSVCKNETDVPKRKTDLFEKRVGPKVPQGVEKLPNERRNKLMGTQSNAVSSSKLVKENLRPSLSGAMKDKKSAIKDIVMVRNSYEDIHDPEVEDQNKQTKSLEGPTSNGANHSEFGTLKGKHVPVNESCADMAGPEQTEVAPAVPPDNWVGCDRCGKWRLLPIGIETDDLPEKWLCSMLTWLPGKNSCAISEDETTQAVQEMNLQILSRNQDNHQGNCSVGYISHSDHTMLNVKSETMHNGWKKNKSRPEGSSSSLIETSHSSIDAQQHDRQRRKSLNEGKQQLVEKNVVNKPIDAERLAAKVTGGDVNPKKLKSKIGSDQYDNVTSNQIKNGSERDMEKESDHRPRDKLVISVKRQAENTQLSLNNKLLDRKSCERGEMPAKKRKLKDWQESPPCSSTVKEKRLKTSNTEVKGDERSLIKGKTMKIKFPGSRENSVDTSHEKKNLNATTSSRKDLESERFAFAATSSSSKVSGSCRRASLQEIKGSPVGSVSSSPLRAVKLSKLSPASGRIISRKAHLNSDPATEIPRKVPANGSQSQRLGKAEPKHKEASEMTGTMNTHSSGKGSLLRSKGKDEKLGFQRVKVKASDPMTEQESVPTKIRRVEVDGPGSNDSYAGKKLIRKRLSESIGDQKPVSLTERALSEVNLADMGSSGMNSTVKKDFLNDTSKKKDPHVEGRSSKIASLDLHAFKSSDTIVSKVMKHPGDAANQNAKSLVKHLSVISFLKEYALSQTATTALKKAEESKDYADRLKMSGFDYECNDAYFDSALKFLHTASLLEACNTDVSNLKVADLINVYSTSAKLSKICAQEYQKRKEMAAAALAYKCMEVACMRIAYCKSFMTKQDLQPSMQMVTQGESPSSSSSDVDNLNNQATTMDKTMLSKNIAHLGNHVVARSQTNFMRLLDFTRDVNLAMEASMNTQNAYKAAIATPEESQNKEMTSSVKRVVDFSFQDVKEVVCLVQIAREATIVKASKAITGS